MNASFKNKFLVFSFKELKVSKLLLVKAFNEIFELEENHF